jgi:hypothetical protein
VTTVYRLPALDKAAPIVQPDGRITPYFQRFWQNLTFTAVDGANQNADITALQSSITTINGQITGLTSSKAPKLTTFTAATGTADRTTFATYAAPTISNPPTQAEVQAIADHLQVLSRHMKAMIDDLK